MIKKYGIILLTILIMLAFAACDDGPAIEGPPPLDEVETEPVAEEPEEEEEEIPEPTPEAAAISPEDALDMAYEAYNQVMDRLFLMEGAVDVGLIIDFAVEALGVTTSYGIHGNMRLIGDDAGNRMAVSMDFGDLEGAVEVYIIEDEYGDMFIRFAKGEEVLEWTFDNEEFFVLEMEELDEIFDMIFSYIEAFHMADLLFEDFLSAEIEEAEVGTIRYYIVIDALASEDIIWENEYMYSVLDGFIDSFIESSGIDIEWPLFQEGLLLIVTDTDGTPRSMRVEIEMDFDVDGVDMTAQFAMEYIFNAFGPQVVIERPA